MERSNGTLRRDLGFWTALTIGTGTMIGAGIFLLSGIAVTLAGPAAIFSYLLAAFVCIITAASAAELATGMPTSGGDYFFVSRSLGPPFGAISGIGIWLSLTFAIAFYLFGMGEYLSEFLPLTAIQSAILGGIFFTALNVFGARESGNTQVVVVLTLLTILVGFILGGLFYLNPTNLHPFIPYGVKPIFTTTALVFISFLGFVKIAAVSEEIKEPGKNIPRALIGSVALVSLLYVLIVLIIAGIFPPDVIGTVRSPLTVAAEMMFGRTGAGILIFAGLLATLSSANASIMAASRINLAMARDNMIPHWLSEIHPTRLTPYRSILITGALALAFLFVNKLETLAEIASVLQLYSYGAINIGAVVLRVAAPPWYKPAYRAPGTPYLQFLAALGCLGIVFLSGLVAQAIIVGLIVMSLSWYFIWGRSRVKLRYGMPIFQRLWREQGWRVLFAPEVVSAPVQPPVPRIRPSFRAIDAASRRRVLVALANPRSEPDLLRLGRYIATGREAGGEVFGFHVVKIPLQVPLKVAREHFTERASIEQTIAWLATQAQRAALRKGRRPVEKTQIQAVTDVGHDVSAALTNEVLRREADLLLLGWKGGFSLSRIYHSPVQHVLAHVQADVAVLKNRGLEPLDTILVPWGGGPHALAGLELAVRVAEGAGARVRLLRVVKPGVDVEKERRLLARAVQHTVGEQAYIDYLVLEHKSVSECLQETLQVTPYGLVVIGASQEWVLRRVLFGTIPDLIADSAPCSVLVVRRWLPDDWQTRTALQLRHLKEQVGMSSSSSTQV